jgi:hypothetical protein
MVDAAGATEAIARRDELHLSRRPSAFRLDTST